MIREDQLDAAWEARNREWIDLVKDLSQWMNIHPSFERDKRLQRIPSRK